MSGEKSETFTNFGAEVSLGALRFVKETSQLKDANGATVRLRRQSNEVLAFLVAHAGRVVSKAELLENVWPQTFVTDDSVGQCIVEIRRALNDTDHKIVQTFPKKGYMLVPTDSDAEPVMPSEAKGYRGNWVVPVAAIVLVVAFAVFIVWQYNTVDDAAAGLVLPPEPSIIVLPFDNQSDEANVDYLAAGFSTSIRTQLSKFPQLFVIAGSTSATFKDSPGTARGIGRELGVRYVVEGNVRELGDGYAVSAELIEAESERTIWAEQYDLGADNALLAQADVVQEIVATLNVVVGEEELSAVRLHPTASPRAHDLFMRAEAATGLVSQEGRVEAVQLLERAIEIDPEYLDAHFELSGRYLSLYRFGATDDPDEALRLARHHAEKALEISRSDYRGHFRMGMLYLFADHEHDLAFASFQRALKDNPNDADVLYNMGFLRSLMGEPKEAIAWNDKAKRINPRYPGWYNFNAAQSRFFIGDYAAAELLARAGVAEYPTALPPRRILIVTLVETGRLAEAREEVEDYLAISPDFRLSTFRNTPFQHEVDRARYYGALRTAGIPD